MRGELCLASYFLQAVSLGCVCDTVLPNGTQFCQRPPETRIILPLLWERDRERQEEVGDNIPLLWAMPLLHPMPKMQKLGCSLEGRWQERVSSEDGRAERTPLGSSTTSLSYSINQYRNDFPSNLLFYEIINSFSFKSHHRSSFLLLTLLSIAWSFLVKVRACVWMWNVGFESLKHILAFAYSLPPSSFSLPHPFPTSTGLRWGPGDTRLDAEGPLHFFKI